MEEQIARNRRRSIACVVAFVVVWAGVGGLIGWLVAVLAGRPAGVADDDAITGVGIATLAALLAAAFSVLSGARLVLAVAGARPSDPARFPVLNDVVAALAVGADLPMPAVYVVDDPAPNAFATGTSPDRAAVTVTTGLLAVMDREELEGVLAHELSHIRNYDTRLLLVVTTLIGLAGLLASMLWRSTFFVRGRGRDAGQVTAVLLLAGALLAIVGFVVGPLIRFAVSRRRESLADVSGVELTRNPIGLLRALRTLQASDVPSERINHVTAALCIDDPLQHHAGAVHRLFDTHPPLAERIAVLEALTYGSAV
ncbi:MAG: M48 family metallopeptidase [Jatrophihabitans sp.]|uniref:M48 family metallopeptidase n=1 Tax=Jatrophihabitans sp. TaxID=1932789 RepID=UPI003F7DB872